MTDYLFKLWWGLFVTGRHPEMRRQICRAMLLSGTGNRFFDLEGPYRVGHRRWNID